VGISEFDQVRDSEAKMANLRAQLVAAFVPAAGARDAEHKDSGAA
jgi:hypothetical protein